jgi:hypothetical protein
MTRKQKELEKLHKANVKWRACGRKEKYETQSEADYAGKAVNFHNRTNIDFKSYFCPFCSHYHLTGN